MISLTMAGHFGGSLTHGSDYLTHYMPNGIKKVVGLPPRSNTELKKITNLDEALVFDDIIYPILDAHCISCHNESKSKGGLMLHTQQTIMKGGEGGAVLLAGSPEQSEIIRLINLPKIDDDHMPPSGKNQLSNEQIDLLDWWIREGASFNKTVAEIYVDEKVQEILNTLVDPDANKSEVEILLASGIKPAKRQTLVSFHEKGLKVLPLAAKMNWLQVKVSQNQSADSLVTTGLNEITDQLTWLDLGNTDATDKSLGSIGELKNLTRLHLENTLVTDQGLQNLEKLKYLEYLNLFGTKITDEGINELSGLKNLRKLYVWQTDVSKEGIQQLLKSLPELEVYTGMEIGENPASGDENI
ncbi:MAG: c-type cytochrome domain-containing protein, partial [Fulvivirga sp.]